MILEITNAPRPYAWGSLTELASFQGREPTGRPEAELWLGAHPHCPSRILEPHRTRGHERLDSWIAADPATALGDSRPGGELPFLMKVLGIEHPLSLQVHPSTEDARRGFDAERARGLPSTSDRSVYRDAHAKPELMLPIREPASALVGFRPVRRTQALVNELLARLPASCAAHREALSSLLLVLAQPVSQALDGALAALLDTDLGTRATEAVVTALGAWNTAGARVRVGDDDGGRDDEASELSRDVEGLRELAELCPGDAGLAVALLMNRASPQPGEAVYVAPGVIHAYLSGLAAEVMAPSDNVARAGFTNKHVDPAELRRITVTRELEDPRHEPQHVAPGVRAHRPADTAFQVVDLGPAPHPVPADLAQRSRWLAPSEVELTGPAIALDADGECFIEGELEGMALERGQAVYVTPAERTLRVGGHGRLILAMPK